MALYQQSFSVFSTYVEVIPMLDLTGAQKKGFLHVCGGDPDNSQLPIMRMKFSPRMWR